MLAVSSVKGYGKGAVVEVKVVVAVFVVVVVLCVMVMVVVVAGIELHVSFFGSSRPEGGPAGVLFQSPTTDHQPPTIGCVRGPPLKAKKPLGLAVKAGQGVG